MYQYLCTTVGVMISFCKKQQQDTVAFRKFLVLDSSHLTLFIGKVNLLDAMPTFFP